MNNFVKTCLFIILILLLIHMLLNFDAQMVFGNWLLLLIFEALAQLLIEDYIRKK